MRVVAGQVQREVELSQKSPLQEPRLIAFQPPDKSIQRHPLGQLAFSIAKREARATPRSSQLNTKIQSEQTAQGSP
jgi:hypothetical protein